MQATIITIGDEILIGQVIDTNSAFMGEELNKIGVKVAEIDSISDTHESIISALDRCSQNSEIVLVTGGLGPTKDDITKHAFADYFNCKLIRHQPTLKKIEDRFNRFGFKMTEINKAQADVPEVCEILTNHSGSAPGMLFKTGKGIVVSMPGVPYEMKDLMNKEVIPYLKKNFQLPHRINKTFLTVGVAESILSDRLENFEAQLPKNFSLAYLPSPSRVRLRLSGYDNDKSELHNEFEKQSELLESELNDDLFGYNKDTLERVVGEVLSKYSLTLATAESCTGGNVAKTVTSVPGASTYFLGSIVSYSNSSKENLLEVTKEALETHGAVSKEAVLQMAENVKVKFNSDFGIATSGIAGPTGGTEEKPVGTVWIAISSPKRTIAVKFNFGDNRERTVIRSTVTALNLLRKEIKSTVEKTVNKV